MKKVKIMLLSLALFAIMGGALAFKPKMREGAFCTVAAYQDELTGTFYCSFDQGDLNITTKQCDDYNITSHPVNAAVKPVCTTTLGGVHDDAGCQTLACDIQTSIVHG